LQQEIEALRHRIDVRQLHGGVEIRTTSFVGNVNVGPIRLAIRPKLPAMPLTQLFRYAYGLRDLSLERMTRVMTARYAFHDLLIAMLATEARELLNRGLCKQYVPIDQKLASPRGRILVASLARFGGVVNATLDCRHHERRADWLLNQVLRTGLLHASRIANDRALRYEAHELSSRFDGIRVRPVLLARDLSVLERGLTRLTDFNASALTLVRLLHDMMGVDLQDSKTSQAMSGFLFDMNRFFQRLLSRFLREHLATGSIIDERRIRHIFTYAPDANPRNRSAPKPRPDYALLDSGKVQGFLDAKYRDVWRLGASETWIYQLSIYALASPRRVSIMLYRSLDADARDERLEVRQPVGDLNGPPATVVIRPVPLMQLAELLGSQRAQADRRRLAEQLVRLKD